MKHFYLLSTLVVLLLKKSVVASSQFPVFIQHLASGDVTFPNDQCLQCRGDKLDVCLSSRIECQEKGLAVEMLWSGSSRCEGPPNRVSRSIPTDFISCPGPDHFSPMNIDMDRFVSKLQKDFKAEFPNNETAEAAILEYRRMLILNQLYPEVSIVPSYKVDKVWHTHILDTVAYHRDSLRMFGKYLHHAPSFGGKEEKLELLKKHKSMLEMYQEHFGEDAPVELWPVVKPTKLGHYLPNCCKAFCVKQECSDETTKSGDCIGCDPNHCGYDNDVSWSDQTPGKPMIVARVKQPLSPAQFGGYAPFEQVDHPFAFSVVPINKDGVKLTYSWNISGEDINHRLVLSGRKTWFGLGYGTGDDRMNDGGMGYADYNIVLYSHNYTGVYDLYKYNKGNDYPCFDILYECSKSNKTKGVNNIEKAQVSRSGSTTTAYWSRKLNTGDPKDYVIGTKTLHVMFAYGDDDWFTEHKKKKTCKINAHTGSAKCGDDAWGLKAMRARLAEKRNTY